jgi:hypothetical protein
MSNRILKFDAWKKINEANQALDEAKGVSRAVKGALTSFFEDHGKGSYEQAKDYVATKVKGWELSKEDYEEAKSMMKESLDDEDEILDGYDEIDEDDEDEILDGYDEIDEDEDDDIDEDYDDIDEATKNLPSRLDPEHLLDGEPNHAKKVISKATDKQREKLEKKIKELGEENPDMLKLLDYFPEEEKEEDKEEKKSKD